MALGLLTVGPYVMAVRVSSSLRLKSVSDSPSSRLAVKRLRCLDYFWEVALERLRLSVI